MFGGICKKYLKELIQSSTLGQLPRTVLTSPTVITETLIVYTSLKTMPCCLCSVQCFM